MSRHYYGVSTVLTVALASSLTGSALTRAWSASPWSERTVPADSSLSSSVRELHKPNFEVLYDRRLRSPILVRERLGTKAKQGPRPKRGRWRADPDVAERWRITTRDAKAWAKRGYDRGHLVPAADCRDEKTMHASFLLSNAAPQSPRLNKTVWAELEKLTREVADSPGVSHVDVFTGPLFLCTEKQDKSTVRNCTQK